MTITIQAELVHVPLAKQDIHHDTLRKELEAYGEAVKGVLTTGEDATNYALVQSVVSDKLAAEITEALQGYEKRIGGQYSRESDLEFLRTKYPPDVVDLVAQGKAAAEAIELQRWIIGDIRDVSIEERNERILKATSDPQVKTLVSAAKDFSELQRPVDIRLTILDELRAKFGDVIVNLSIMHGDAYVSVRGDIPAGLLDKVHDTVAKHDKSKAPPPEPTIEEKYNALLKRLEALEGKKAK